jgi:hypothetical protein
MNYSKLSEYQYEMGRYYLINKFYSYKILSLISDENLRKLLEKFSD